MLADLEQFWACVDVLAVPSAFDPFSGGASSLREHPSMAFGILGAVDPAVGFPLF